MLVKIFIIIYFIIGFLFCCIGLAGLKYSNKTSERSIYRLWEDEISIDEKLLFYCKMMILWLPLITIKLVEILVKHIMSA